MTDTDKVFRVDAPEMADAVRWAAKHADNVVVLEIENGTLTVSGFENPNLTRATCDVEQKFDGKTKLSVHPDILLNALKVFKKNVATFTIERSEGGGGRMVATTGRAKIAIPFSGENTRAKLPDTPEILGTVMADDFKRSLDEVADASAAPDQASAVILTALNVRFYPNEGLLVMAATDRYRLVMRKVEMEFSRLDFGAVGSFDVNLSARDIKSMLKSINIDGTLNILHNGPKANGDHPNRAIFGFSGAHQMGLVGVIDGDYINYAKLIQKGADKVVIFDRKSFLTTVNDAKMFLERKDSRMTITASSDNVTLTSPDADFDFDVDFNSVEFSEEETIDVSADLLSRALIACRAPNISFEFNGSSKPILLFDLDEKGEKDTQTYNMMMSLAERR